MLNAFLDLADRQITAPVKARQRAAEKRAARKAVDSRDQLNVAWRRWHDEKREALLVGPHGDAARHLIAFLGNMTLDQGAELVALVKAGPWRHTDGDTRFEIMALIDAHIIKLRERSNLPPFDDALTSARPNVFPVIREVLS